MVDTLDTLNGECGFRDRLLMPNVSAFPSPRALPLTKLSQSYYSDGYGD